MLSRSQAPALPAVIAHRGASGYAPEHTIPAYDLAVTMGADYIEQDLQLTRDGTLIVLHDASLDRTTSCSGLAIEKTLAEVTGCDAGSWFGSEFAGARIPTLRQLFERYGHGVSYYIETKNPDDAPGMEAALVALLDEFGFGEEARPWQVLIQSFSRSSLLAVRTLNPALPLIQLVEDTRSSAQIQADLEGIASYAVGIGPAHDSVDAALVDGAHAAGLVVHPYTVNAPGDMKRILALGVDGAFTDYPDRLRALIQ